MELELYLKSILDRHLTNEQKLRLSKLNQSYIRPFKTSWLACIGPTDSLWYARSISANESDERV